jgi:hypothetical protein
MSSYQEKLFIALTKATGNDGSFTNVFRDVIASSSVSDLLNGIPARVKIHSMTTALQHLADGSVDETESKQLWNPIIAAYATILEEISQQHPEIFSQGQPQLNVLPKAKKETTKAKSKIVQDCKSQSSKPQTGSSNVTVVIEPISSSDDGSSSLAFTKPVLPVAPRATSSAKCDTSEIRANLLRFYQSTREVLYPKFCSRSTCKFCSDLYISTEITRCGPECKGIYPHGSQEVGWYPHVGKGLRGILNKSHRNNVEYTYRQKAVLPGAIECLRTLLIGESGEPISTRGNKKRKSDATMDVDEALLSRVKTVKVSPSPLGPKALTDTVWSEEVETASLSEADGISSSL